MPLDEVASWSEKWRRPLLPNSPFAFQNTYCMNGNTNQRQILTQGIEIVSHGEICHSNKPALTVQIPKKCMPLHKPQWWCFQPTKVDEALYLLNDLIFWTNLPGELPMYTRYRNGRLSESQAIHVVPGNILFPIKLDTFYGFRGSYCTD